MPNQRKGCMAPAARRSRAPGRRVSSLEVLVSVGQGAPGEVAGGNAVADVAPGPGPSRASISLTDVVTGRRPMMEATLARVAAVHAGLDDLPGRRGRGACSVRRRRGGRAARRRSGDDDGHGRADLVVDAGGRRPRCRPGSPPSGPAPTVDEHAECGWIYYGRHFRSPDGTLPRASGRALGRLRLGGWAMLAADNGTWAVGSVTSAADPELGNARHVEGGDGRPTQLPGGRPLDRRRADLRASTCMAGIEDRRRRLRRRRRSGGDGCGARGRRVGVHQPVARAGCVDRPAATPCACATALRDVPATEAREFVTPIRRAHDGRGRAACTATPSPTTAIGSARCTLRSPATAYETEDPGWAFAEALRKGGRPGPRPAAGLRGRGRCAGAGVDVAARPASWPRPWRRGTDEPVPGLTHTPRSSPSPGPSDGHAPPVGSARVETTCGRRHAGWWQEGFTEGADAEYVEQILPLAAEHLAGFARVLDVGCGEGQVARLAAAGGAATVVGVDPTLAQVAEARRRGGGPRLRPRRRGGAAVRRRQLRRRRRLPRLRAHPRRRRRPSPRSAGCSRPAGGSASS